MIDILINFISFIAAIGLLVTIHEYGHFWVARRNGIIVKRFSVGFGKVLWRKIGKDGVEYVVSAIPLGGYVSMLDGRADTISPEQQGKAFNQKTVGQRMSVIAAGPIANFLLAILLLALMYLIGVPTVKPVIAELKAGSIAANAQLPTQQIIAINGESVTDWQDVQLLLSEQIGKRNVSLTMAEIGSERGQEFQLDLSTWTFDSDRDSLFGSLGIVPVRAKPLLIAGQIAAKSAAEAAGLQVGDKLIAATGVTLTNWQQLVTIIQNNPGKTFALEVERAGQVLTLQVTPARRQMPDGFDQGYLGMSPQVEQIPAELITEHQLGPIDAMIAGMNKTWQITRVTLSMLKKLLLGDVSVKHLSGPISIAEGAGTSASLGIVAFLMFLAMISVNLGVVNLLPLPILDGGHLMYLVVELIRGKPVSENAQEIGLKIGAFVLLMLMGIALLNDISRL
jgi:regulator of sigma E protease